MSKRGMRCIDARRLWERSRFHLSALLLLVPLALAPAALRTPSPELGARALPERTVGPWSVVVSEAKLEAPPSGEGATKDYNARFCEGCAEAIRAAWLTAGSEPRPGTNNGLLHGSPHQLEAHAPYPARIAPGDRLWLTVEGWDGRTHEVSWPLHEAAVSLARQ